MGITINNKLVTVNSTDKYGASIHWRDNPHHEKIAGMEIVSIFGRTNLRSDEIGDGNPLVHALKKNKDFSIREECIKRLYYHGARTVSKITEHKPAALIVPLPSSSTLNLFFSDYLKRRTGATIVQDVFRKATLGEVSKAKVPVADVPRKLKSKYKSDLTTIERGHPNNLIKIKDIGTKVRGYFNPLRLNEDVLPDPNTLTGECIYVVDDVLASGTTILSGLRTLKEIFPEIEVIGITVFSGLQAKKLDFH